MSEIEPKKCLRCGGEMEKAFFLKASTVIFDAKEVFIATKRRAALEWVIESFRSIAKAVASSNYTDKWKNRRNRHE